MRILITGSTGLVGSSLVDHFQDHDVKRLVREEPESDDEIYWKPSDNTINDDELSGFDAVVHLAGESIVGRWNEEKKEAIRESRVTGTSLLSEALANVEDPPEVLVCASAIGYYGDRGDEVLDESSSSGDLFLSGVCEDWEAAADPAREAGIRVAHARFGVILSEKGGALAQMLTPFKFCLGGRIGDGEQWMSWVDLEDVVRALDYIIQHDDLEGPLNVVTPNPMRNRQYTTALGDVLGRPTLFPMPEFAARLLFGEMADELLLASTRVQPDKLRDHGFTFEYPHIKDSLVHLLISREEELSVMEGSSPG
jgi:uncharacterized protein (TIGR01777 family)